jgi:hypothetical protein
MVLCGRNIVNIRESMEYVVIQTITCEDALKIALHMNKIN